MVAEASLAQMPWAPTRLRTKVALVSIVLATVHPRSPCLVRGGREGKGPSLADLVYDAPSGLGEF